MMTTQPMLAPATICPYCGHSFGKVLNRGRNCPACNGAVKMRTPFPFTSADNVLRIAMTVAQADAEHEQWRQKGIREATARDGYDVTDRAQRMAHLRKLTNHHIDGIKSHPDIAGVEIKAHFSQPCSHPIIGLWDILDYPQTQPSDCPHEFCLCMAQPFFRDEIRGRFIAGWRTYDNEEK